MLQIILLRARGTSLILPSGLLGTSIQLWGIKGQMPVALNNLTIRFRLILRFRLVRNKQYARRKTMFSSIKTIGYTFNYV